MFDKRNESKKKLYDEQSYNRAKEMPKKWTLNLILCCLTVSLCSFQFGYNISSLNSATVLVKKFMHENFFLYSEYNNGKQLFENGLRMKQMLLDAEHELESTKAKYVECNLSSDDSCLLMIEEKSRLKKQELIDKYNYTGKIEDFLKEKKELVEIKLEEGRLKLEKGKKKVDKANEIFWTVLNCLFVLGGMTGGFTSKYVLDFCGRKYGIVFHNLFTVLASVLVLIAPYFKSPVCVFISRFLFGVQGAMSCSLVPTYLSEIAPSNLRGQVGVLHQLFITIGILVAQIFGFKEILGAETTWNIFLAIPVVPSILGSFLLIALFPETPKALLIKNRDRSAAEKALQKLRNQKDVEQELGEIEDELNNNNNNNGQAAGESRGQFGLFDLFKSKELRWPVFTAIILNIAQQLSGVNAIFYYSAEIFLKSGIAQDSIQYAILSTGVVNVLMTIVCVPLIDKLGRKPLLVYPISIIIFNFVALTIFLSLKETSELFSYLGIVCIMIFIMCFAVGLGPIPFLYTAEVFPQSARGAAMSIAVVSNWLSCLLITLTFPFLHSFLNHYVFCIFAVIMALTLAVTLQKVPETKNKSVEQILAVFNKNKESVHFKPTTFMMA